MDENYVCFMCTRCKQPVKLDSTFDVIDDHTVQELISSSRAAANLNKSPSECSSDVNDGSSRSVSDLVLTFLTSK